jgi:malate dehydrogenase (oxaloacetate-decarboxylating)(NADP+)
VTVADTLHYNLGLGLGSILARASSVTDGMVEASSLGLADSLAADERKTDSIYPSLDRIREISAFIAMRVIRQAQKEVRDLRLKCLNGMIECDLLMNFVFSIVECGSFRGLAEDE